MPGVTSEKAAKILKDGTVNGKALSPKQRRYMAAKAHGAKMKDAKDGALVTSAADGDEVAEGEPTAMRQGKASKDLIMEGMKEGGAIKGPKFKGSSGEQDDKAAGLRAVAEVYKQKGQAGVNALRVGQAAERRRHRSALGTARQNIQHGYANQGYGQTLASNVSKAYDAIVKGGQSSKQVHGR